MDKQTNKQMALTTKFSLVQIESICKRCFVMLPKKFTLTGIEKKTLWKKEKMLVTSIFSFSHNVFKGPIPQDCQQSS